MPSSGRGPCTRPITHFVQSRERERMVQRYTAVGLIPTVRRPQAGGDRGAISSEHRPHDRHRRDVVRQSIEGRRHPLALSGRAHGFQGGRAVMRDRTRKLTRDSVIGRASPAVATFADRRAVRQRRRHCEAPRVEPQHRKAPLAPAACSGNSAPILELATCFAERPYETNGFFSLSPKPWKSARLRVTRVRSLTRAIAAICLSSGWLGSGTLSRPQT